MGKNGASNRRSGGKGAGAVRAAGGSRRKRIVVTAAVAVVVLVAAVPLIASAVSGGLSAPFASASTATVTFDTGDGGSEVDSQTVASGGHAVKPATTPTRSGYVFGGWYTSADGGSTLSTMDYDFGGAAVSGDTVLYAKWLPVQTKSAESNPYFMATSALTNDVLSKFYRGTATDEEKSANNFRSASDIAADMAVLHGEKATNNQGEDKTAVTSRWTTYMDSDPGGSSYSHTDDYAWGDDTVHLYTKWTPVDGETVSSDEDLWVELRVVEVGAHLNTAGDDSSADGSAVTFMAVHSLLTAKAMNAGNYNSGGWGQSQMRTNVMQFYVLAGFDDSFESALKWVGKETVNTDAPASGDTASITGDGVWLMSYKELTGTTQDYAGDEGEQYSWFSDKITEPTTDTNEAIEGLCYTRSASEPKGLDDTYVWLRSPRLNGSYNFLEVASDGCVGAQNADFWFGVCPALAM
jgi:uncharacterized repeat protein (TIGR02543 family)